MFLYIVSWLATAVQILFLTVALASALYYMAELVEEYTVMAGKIIKFVLTMVSLIYVGLYVFESFPPLTVAVGLLSSAIYFLLLRDFPFISLTSPIFLSSIVLVFVNHYLAFQHFSKIYYSFSEVMAYFTICLWMLPFAFFVSLSASDNVLPTATTTHGTSADYTYAGQSKRSGVLALFDYFYVKFQYLWPTRTAKSF